MSTVIGLIATYPREESLIETSIPSIANQSILPDEVVIVSDRCTLSQKTKNKITDILSKTKVVFLDNTHNKGAGGSWNTGLEYIQEIWNNPYVAILDDDDSWEHNHLSECLYAAQEGSCDFDVVISGLRLIKNGVEVSRPLVGEITIEDFLIGNPGWQGSNTFVRVSAAMNAEGFTESLTSCHDRDFAIRLLDLPNINIAFTNKFTANWNFNAHHNCLSIPGPKKRAGLSHFYNINKHRMNEGVKKKFFQRCTDLFSMTESDFNGF